MTENKRFKAHIFDDGVNERYYDGIIDNENDENVIRNYQYISRLLNELNDEVVKGDLFKLTVAMAIQHRINWLKKQIWDNTDRIDELQSLKKELKL